MFDPMSIALMKKLGGGGGASSWNDLTDKPFGSVEQITTFADSVSVAGEEDSDRSLGNFNLVIGEEYTVEFDGVRYEKLVCFDDGGFNTIGAPWDDFTNYPFSIYYDGHVICYYGGAEAHVVSVYQKTETVQTIDPKYLPAGVGGGVTPINITETVTADGYAYTVDFDFSEAYDMDIDTIKQALRYNDSLATVCVYVGKENSRSSGNQIIMEFLTLSVSSANEYITSNIVLVWRTDGVFACTATT